MPSLHVVIIWLLAITLGGLMITGAFLIVTRDTGQRASGQRVTRRQRQHTLERWEATKEAARRRLEARGAMVARRPDPGRPTTLACSGVGHRLCDGFQHIAPGETTPCECWCHCMPAAVTAGYDRPEPVGSLATGLWQIIPARPPAVDEATVARLTQAMIEASIRRVYAESEQRQVLELARTAWSTWQG